MRNKLLSFGLTGLTAVLLSSFAYVQIQDKKTEPKKERHIKMMKMENGKKMELDTILTNDDIFVWNGDTINPVKHVKKFNAVGFDKMHKIDVEVDNKDGKEKVMIFRHGGGKGGEPTIWNMDSGDDMEIVTDDIDSLGERIVVRKRVKDGEGNHLMFFNGEGMKHFPPVPPRPPVPPVKMMMKHSGRIIDLNDPKIISYKKKEMSGNREKIEIIREKSDESENMNFNFNFDEAIDAPVGPVIIHDMDADRPVKKEIKREIKIEEKAGQKIEEEKKSEENK